MVAESSGSGSIHYHTQVVSVIIPARNEESNIERCLRSIVTQRGLHFEVIVVDDESDDRTRQIAEGFRASDHYPFIQDGGDLRAVRVIPSRCPLPPGWTGKANACWAGYQASIGNWLLFTDADTEHMPGSLAGALQEAEEHGAGLLSYSPEQVLHGFTQKALMPVIFGELATRYRPAVVSDPRSKSVAANGQYLLIRRNVYEQVGGHRAVRASLLEDVDLARLVKAKGIKLRFRLGRGKVRAYMYRGWKDMRDGWTKNLALLFPDATKLAGGRLLEFAIGILGLVGGVVLAGAGATAAGVVSLAVGIVAFGATFRRIRRAHFGWAESAVATIGEPIFAWLLCRSASRHREGTLDWKGRNYSPSATLGTAGESNQEENVAAFAKSPGQVQ